MPNPDQKNPISWRIGRRVAKLREDRGWSLEDLARATKDLLTKSRLSNYEQGTRRLDIEGAKILAGVFGRSAAHILCLDDDQPLLGPEEVEVIANLRALPENERAAYSRRIAAIALAYRDPVPDEAVVRNGYSHPGKRQSRSKKPA